MISIRVKTQSLELEMSSDASESLSEVASEFVRVAQSEPVQNSIQAPIVLHQLPAAAANNEKQAQLSLFASAEADNEKEGEKQPQQRQVAGSSSSNAAETRKRLSNGNGEESKAYNKMLDMIPKGFFDSGKGFAEITSALSKAGYNTSAKRLADALLRLVREEHLVREGERRRYMYKRADDSVPSPTVVATTAAVASTN